MTIEEQQEAIREAAEYELCETLGYWYDIKRVDIENAVGLLFGKLTEKGAVLRSHWADCKAPPSGKAFTAVIDGVCHIADCGCPNTAPLMEKE